MEEIGSPLAHWTPVGEEGESKWCLEDATELLAFTKQLASGEEFMWWHRRLWFHFDKLDPTARCEVENIAKDIPSSDGLSDLDWYLDLIGQEAERTRLELDGFTEEDRLARLELRARLVTMEGDHRRLARTTGRGADCGLIIFVIGGGGG